MGTEIYLKVGPVMLDWSKNSRGDDHGVLFQEHDRTHIHSDQTDYACCEEHGIDAEPNERALVRTLKSIVPRLDLLGFTVDTARSEYERIAADCADYQDEDASFLPPLHFSEFLAFLSRHPLGTLDDTFIEGFDEESTRRMQGRFASDPAVSRIPTWDGSGDGYSEASYFASLIRILHPYSVMRLLALVPDNLQTDVSWEYGAMVVNGWAGEEAFTACARRKQTFLIATEGTSDVHILKHALSLLMPDIEDFFRFIDVSERHPFSGTGSLVNFAEGLTKIDVQNQVVFLFDNDAEGWAAFEKVQGLTLPQNMCAMVLPDVEDFREFPGIGPHGVLPSDINRRAAGIECYLDLRLEGRPPAQVLWTNFKKDRNDYQGSLEHKETYMRKFLEQSPHAILSGTYDVSKLRLVLERLFQACSAIAAQAQSV